MKNRIGLGYDLHRLGGNRKLFLGGVEIPSDRGLIGHSDADCLIHAIIDALLGASGEGDIGKLFPDTDPAFKNVRSTELLKEVVSRLKSAGLEIVNVDSVIVAEAPLIGPYVTEMKKTLSPLLHIAADSLGIKGKTNEGLGLIGEGQAMACWATALVRERARHRAEKKFRTNEKRRKTGR